MKLILVLSVFFISGISFAYSNGFQPGRSRIVETTPKAYYGKDFYTEVERDSRNNQLKGLLRIILTNDHLRVANDFDEIQITTCAGKTGCYRHTPIGYNSARVFLLGSFYLVKTPAGYGVREVYCSRVYDYPEFGDDKPAPGKIPTDKVVNVEHTWPQSRFNRRFSTETQKADLHHLFPTDSQLNSTRGSFEFGMVTKVMKTMDCADSKFGIGADGHSLVFEPPVIHRGNVARALFYFSTRYDIHISPFEEATLKLWNKQDPVDQNEQLRNEEIFKVQGTRNPFIDYPELADRITDF